MYTNIRWIKVFFTNMFKKFLYILFILSFSSYAAASQLAITDGECGDYGAMVLYGDVVDDDSCDAMVPYEPKTTELSRKS